MVRTLITVLNSDVITTSTYSADASLSCIQNTFKHTYTHTYLRVGVSECAWERERGACVCVCVRGLISDLLLSILNS